MARRRRGRISRSKQNQAGKSTSSSTGGGGTGGGGTGGGGGNSGGGGGGGGGNNSGGGGGNQGGGNQGGNNNQGKKDSKITQRNIARFGEKHVRNLQQKQKDFKSVQNKTMSRSAFAAKHYGKGYGTTGNVGRSLARRPETQRELDIINANRLDSQRLGAEATRLTGIPSGVNLRPGMLTFSDQGRELAAKNRAEAQAKKARQFDTSRLSNAFSDKAFNQYMQSGGIRGINMSVFNNPNNYLNRGMNQRIKNEQFARFGDPFSTFRKNINPKTLFGDDALQVGKSDKTFAAGKRGNPFGRIDQAFNPFRPADKGGPGSGPTPLTRETIKRFGPTTLNFASSLVPGYNIGKQIFNEGRADSATTKAISNIDNVNVGGLSIGFNSPESTDIGARVGKFFTSLPGKVANMFTGGDTRMATTDAGGLNLGNQTPTVKGDPLGRTIGNRFLGGIDAVVGTDLDGLGGRTTPFGERLTSSIDSFGTLNQNLSDLSGQSTGPINTAKNLAGSLMLGRNVSMEDLARTTEAATRFKEDGVATGLKSLTPQTTQSVGDVYNALEAGRLTQPFTGTDLYKQGLTNFGGENFQGAIRENVNYFTEKYGQLTSDPAQNRKVVTEMLSAKDPRLDSLKALGYQMKENPKLGIQDQVKNALKPNAPQLKGINKDEMGITGSLGNFILSNQGRNVVTGNLPGTNNALDLASNIINTGRDPSSSTYNASQGFLRTIGAGGQPTPGSIIRGLIPRGGRRGTRRDRVTVGSSATPQLLEELLINQTQTPTETPTQTPTQTGGDAGNLAGIQQQAYLNALGSYGIDPNLFARIQERQLRQMNNPFRNTFIRNYF